jgi:hypothetical protein
MEAAYGDRWNDRIADEDAKRRPNGRRYPVAKTDLAVLLKVIQFERIEPWAGAARPDPRIRSYASEILTLRNMWAHGEDCIGEHARLRDTASRFLRLLDLEVPAALATNVKQPASETTDIVPTDLPPGDFEREIRGLGPEGERLGALLAEMTQLVSRIGASADRDDMAVVGADVVRILDETESLGSDAAYQTASLQALIRFIRVAILGNELIRLALVAYVVNLPEPTTNEGFAEAAEQLERFTAWKMVDAEKLNRETIHTASQMPEGSIIASTIILTCDLDLSNDPNVEPEDKLELLRDASARARMLAAMEPGSSWETYTALLLRREGKLCNDLGRSDEAIRAFARADEIIDRYPAADPDIAMPGLV